MVLKLFVFLKCGLFEICQPQNDDIVFYIEFSIIKMPFLIDLFICKVAQPDIFLAWDAQTLNNIDFLNVLKMYSNWKGFIGCSDTCHELVKLFLLEIMDSDTQICRSCHWPLYVLN